LAEAGSNAFTMSPSRWVELTGAVGILSKNGAGGGTYAQRDIAFKFASWVSVEFELYLVKEFQRLKEQEQALLGWSADQMGISYKVLNDILNCRRPITTQTAILFEAPLGISTSELMRMQLDCYNRQLQPPPLWSV
jgi:hypothetical protein